MSEPLTQVGLVDAEGNSVDLADPTVAQRVVAGELSAVRADGKAATEAVMVGQDGGRYAIPLQSLGRAIAEQGMRFETAEENRRHVLEAKHGDEKLQTFVESLVDGATLGAAGVIASSADPDYYERVQERRETNASTAMLGEVASFFTPGIAAKAGKAAIASKSPNLGALVRGIEHAPITWPGAVAEAAGKAIVGKGATSQLSRAAIEGAVDFGTYEAVRTITGQMAGDQRMADEQVVDALGQGLAMGGAFGLAGGALGMLGRKVLGGGLAPALRSTLERQSLKNAGVTKERSITDLAKAQGRSVEDVQAMAYERLGQTPAQAAERIEASKAAETAAEKALAAAKDRGSYEAVLSQRRVLEEQAARRTLQATETLEGAQAAARVAEKEMAVARSSVKQAEKQLAARRQEIRKQVDSFEDELLQRLPKNTRQGMVARERIIRDTRTFYEKQGITGAELEHKLQQLKTALPHDPKNLHVPFDAFRKARREMVKAEKNANLGMALDEHLDAFVRDRYLAPARMRHGAMFHQLDAAVASRGVWRQDFAKRQAKLAEAEKGANYSDALAKYRSDMLAAQSQEKAAGRALQSAEKEIARAQSEAQAAASKELKQATARRQFEERTGQPPPTVTDALNKSLTERPTWQLGGALGGGFAGGGGEGFDPASAVRGLGMGTAAETAWNLLSPRVPRALKRVLKLVETGARITAKPRVANKLLKFQELAAGVRTAAEDPQAFEGEMLLSYGALHQTDPMLAQAIMARDRQIAMFLASKLPAEPTGNLLQPRFSRSGGVPRSEQERFVRYVEAAQNPLVLLSSTVALETNYEAAEAVKQLYPKQFAMWQQEAINEVVSMSKPLPPSKARVLMANLDVPTEAIANPMFAMGVQQKYIQMRQQAEQQRQQPRPSRSGPVPKAFKQVQLDRYQEN